MKKIFRTFTFWFIILAIVEIYLHQVGQDSKNIILIWLNPVLRGIAHSDGKIYEFMNSGKQLSCNTVAGQISVYWYIGAVVTYLVYGVLLDVVKNAYLLRMGRK